MPNPVCTNDGFQFEMTKFIASSGNISSPYIYDTDNHYALNGDNNGVDIGQCSVHLHRTIGQNALLYEAEVIDYRGKTVKQASGTPGAGSPMVIQGLPGGQDVTIPETDDDNDLTHDTNYKVAARAGANVVWTSEFQGVGGAYCVTEEIDEGNHSKDETCFFPCFIG